MYKVAPNYYYPGFWDGTSLQHFFIGNGAWDSLPKSYQSILSSAAAMANIDSIAHYDVLNPPALRRLVGAGTKLRPFPAPIVDAAYRASMSLYDEISASNPTFKTIYESQKNFQKEAVMWNQVSEYAYDTAINRQLRR